MALPSTRDRVPLHTASDTNQQIRREIVQRVRDLQGQPGAIAARLRALDEEWDIERAIEANASTLAFIGVALGYFVDPAWLILPALITAFLFQHALQGWCPPVPVLRRLGFRTAYEIEEERHALKALRGDYRSVGAGRDGAEGAVAAAEA
ncbi:MAG: DUF2892 domain-containing protein [Hyphomicrobium sp.]